MENEIYIDGLKKLRDPFPENKVSKLPKPTKQQTDSLKSDPKNGIRCTVCGGWHHKDVIHLDYVGHAALTDRLLEVDPLWYWEPFAINDKGLPALDLNGGMWIRLYVCGHSRIGYGDAQGKTGGDAIKECIGDALRNAAMRFGAALDLWHKGDLHEDDEDKSEKKDKISGYYDTIKKRVDEIKVNHMNDDKLLNSELTAVAKNVQEDYNKKIITKETYDKIVTLVKGSRV